MHTVLQIPELFEIILKFATSEASAEEARATAISVALASKSFLEQGLDFAWRDVPDIIHLIHLFPRQLWKVKTIYYSHRYPYLSQKEGCPSLVSEEVLCIVTQAQLTTEQYFVRNVVPSDWERFDYYARRVISLRIPSIAVTMPRSSALAADGIIRQRTCLHPNIFSILSHRRPACFPNLRAFDFYENHYLELRQVSGLIGPGLRNLVFGHDYKRSEQIEMQASTDEWRVVVDRCSQLKSLKLIPNGGTWSIFHTMRRMPLLPQLQHFSATSPESESALDTWDGFPDLVSWLSLQPSLKTLDLCWHNPKRVSARSQCLKSSSGQIFPALREVTMIMRSALSDFTGFIARLRDAKLGMIDIVIPDWVYQPNFQDLLETMPRVLDLSALTYFKVHRFKGEIIGPDSEIGEISPLRILFQASNLVHLDLCFSLPFEDMNNSFLQEMAIAWPNLETMSIVGAVTMNSVGLLDVANFACACPRLTTLGLEFDADDSLSHKTDAATLLNSRNTTLRELRVGHSRIKDVNVVASWLSQQFPNLLALVAEQGETEIYLKWEEVMFILSGHKGTILQEHEDARAAEVQRELEAEVYRRMFYDSRGRAPVFTSEEQEIRNMDAHLRQEYPHIYADLEGLGAQVVEDSAAR
ncbi:hypothetical protein EG328_010700 [Venturia inaequalis]|uniref:Uncharacterized protein n=2 Tax=Venturia inaequalis TaxID=5025 RepID=A0A8H3Z6W4_VENIN|nr:hypothetical protein EG328_010700 [Venturia inaequalis]